MDAKSGTVTTQKKELLVKMLEDESNAPIYKLTQSHHSPISSLHRQDIKSREYSPLVSPKGQSPFGMKKIISDPNIKA